MLHDPHLTAAGAIIVEWNVRQPCDVQGGAGMWDTHIRWVPCIFLIFMLTVSMHSMYNTVLVELREAIWKVINAHQMAPEDILHAMQPT